MENLFELSPEKYWDFPSSYSKERKESEILTRIASDDYIASLKKDGHYNRTVIANERIAMQSRTISKVTGEYADKTAHVPHIVDSLKKLPEGTVIIGELYQHGKTSSDMTSILQCLPEKSVKRQKGEYGFVYYYIHDCWYYDGQNLMDEPYSKRIEYVQKIFNNFLKDNLYIEVAEYAKTPEEITNLLNYARENGEEGIVMVRKDAIVSPGKRTAWKTIKVKKELEKEVDCFLTGHYKTPTRLYTGKELRSWIYWEDLKTGSLVFGKLFEDYEAGRPIEPVTKPYYFGWAGSLELGILHNGKVEELGYVSGVNDEIKQAIVEEPDKYSMRPCKVTAMEFTDDKKLRHPRFVEFRDDLNIEDCNWEKIFGEE